jgi:hypothetical protein
LRHLRRRHLADLAVGHGAAGQTEQRHHHYYSPVGKLGDNFVDNSAEARFKVA